ncbi:hypothetical protein ACOSQ3_018238 [Xanthoceras sorbifolium]
MDCFIISAKFLGTQMEFIIKDHHIYTLATLWADVYIARPLYEFVVEELLGEEMYREIWRLDAQDKDKADSVNQEAGDSPVEGSISEESEDANNEDNEEVHDTNTEAADEADEFDENVLSDAATFNFDQDLMLDSSSDDKVEQVKVHKNQEANAVWVARRFKALIEENPEVTVKFLGKQIHRIYGLTLPPYTLYRAKNRVLKVTDSDHHDSLTTVQQGQERGRILKLVAAPKKKKAMKLEIAPKMSMKALHSHLHRMRLFIQVGCKRNNHSPNPMQMVLLAKAMKVVIVDWDL